MAPSHLWRSRFGRAGLKEQLSLVGIRLLRSSYFFFSDFDIGLPEPSAAAAPVLADRVLRYGANDCGAAAAWPPTTLAPGVAVASHSRQRAPATDPGTRTRKTPPVDPLNVDILSLDNLVQNLSPKYVFFLDSSLVHR